MLSSSRLQTMHSVIHRAALPIDARATGEAMLGGEAVPRRLAAVIAVDIDDCSRLVAASEEGTLAGLRPLRRDPIDPNSTRGARSRSLATAC
jgi:hypothetical protein